MEKIAIKIILQSFKTLKESFSILFKSILNLSEDKNSFFRKGESKFSLEIDGYQNYRRRSAFNLYNCIQLFFRFDFNFTLKEKIHKI